MGYSPIFDTVDHSETDLDRVTGAAIGAHVLTHSRDQLRFGGLSVDTATGIATWRGKPVFLGLKDRETLTIMLRRAGQILSNRNLARMMGTSVYEAEQRVRTLRAHLKEAGAMCLPVPVDGIGYILWHA